MISRILNVYEFEVKSNKQIFTHDLLNLFYKKHKFLKAPFPKTSNYKESVSTYKYNKSTKEF